MSDPRDDLAAICRHVHETAAYNDPNEWDYADAIIAAGWVFDGSCRDCQANLDTNGGQHMFHCQTPEGKAQWADSEDDQWPNATN